MIILQLDSLSVQQGTERFFQTSPDTVFGLLTGGMSIAVMVLWWAFYRSVQRSQQNLTDVVLKSAEAMNLVGNNLELLRNANEDDIRSFRESIERLRTEVLMKLDNLAQKK